MRGDETPSRNALTCGKPHTKTSTLRITQGTQACTICRRGTPGAPSGTGPLPTYPGGSHASVGCHTLRNSASEPIETTADTTSTSHGPWKLEIRNCGTAKETPATSTAGQIAAMPRKPANAA